MYIWYRILAKYYATHDWTECMRVSSVFMPFFALIAGAAGFYLRLVELWNVFDRRTGLPERGAGVTLILIILTVAFLLIALMFSIRVRVRYASPRGFENAFGTDPLTYPFAFCVIGLVWLGATVKYFLDLNAARWVLSGELYFSVLSALAAISVGFFAVEMYQDPRRKMIFALSLVPTLFMCFWLIMLYKQNASNPVLLSYCYQCLAIIASALGFYFTSGFVYNKPSPSITIFIYFTAIYFCFVTLADDHTTPVKLIFAAIIALNVTYSSMLIRNLRLRKA